MSSAAYSPIPPVRPGRCTRSRSCPFEQCYMISVMRFLIGFPNSRVHRISMTYLMDTPKLWLVACVQKCEIDHDVQNVRTARSGTVRELPTFITILSAVSPAKDGQSHAFLCLAARQWFTVVCCAPSLPVSVVLQLFYPMKVPMGVTSRDTRDAAQEDPTNHATCSHVHHRLRRPGTSAINSIPMCVTL